MNINEYFTPRDEKNLSLLASELAKVDLSKKDPFVGLAVSTILISMNAELKNKEGKVVRAKDPKGPFIGHTVKEVNIFKELKAQNIIP